MSLEGSKSSQGSYQKTYTAYQSWLVVTQYFDSTFQAVPSQMTRLAHYPQDYNQQSQKQTWHHSQYHQD